MGKTPLWVSALRLSDDFLIVVSSGVAQQQAFEHDTRRWEIETLFGCLKSCGFNLKDTYLIDPLRISKWFALLAAWIYRTARVRHCMPNSPSCLKNGGNAVQVTLPVWAGIPL